MLASMNNFKDRIFISTGGFKDIPGDQAMLRLVECGISSVELSGGAYSSQILQSLFESDCGAKFHFHNYFPVPEEAFVLNLSSLDSEISKKSISHVIKAIDESAKLGITNYSFHAGFLVDPKPKELGKVFQNVDLVDRSLALSLFVERVNFLSDYAAGLGIQLLIENNVVTKENLNKFGDNPFLFTDPLGAKELINELHSNIGILLDVAHLKVSANTLGYKPEEMFDIMNHRIKAYHLSDNDGLVDQNQSVSEASYFWPFIKGDALHYTLEVYGLPFSSYADQVEVTAKMIGKNVNS